MSELHDAFTAVLDGRSLDAARAEGRLALTILRGSDERAVQVTF